MSRKERGYCQKEVQEMLGKSRATIFRWREKGEMPEPYDEGPNILYWDRDVFDEWLRNRKTRRSRPVGKRIIADDDAAVTSSD